MLNSILKPEMMANQLEILAGAIWMTCVVVILIIGLLIAIWVYKDAESRGMSGVLWLLIVWFVAFPIGLIIYLVVRKPKVMAPPPYPMAPPPAYAGAPPPGYGAPPPAYAPPPPGYGAPPPPPGAPGMNCRYCGAPVPPGSMVCPRCGGRL